jgi:hypothetical protein
MADTAAVPAASPPAAVAEDPERWTKNVKQVCSEESNRGINREADNTAFPASQAKPATITVDNASVLLHPFSTSHNAWLATKGILHFTDEDDEENCHELAAGQRLKLTSGSGESNVLFTHVLVFASVQAEGPNAGTAVER